MDLLAIVSQEEASLLPPCVDNVTFETLGPPTGEMWRTDQFNALFTRQKISVAEQPVPAPSAVAEAS
jgi:hypothetical protein